MSDHPAVQTYLDARAEQRRLERKARTAQKAADQALLVLRDSLGGAGAVRLASLTGESKTTLAKRLDRAVAGVKRPRGGIAITEQAERRARCITRAECDACGGSGLDALEPGSSITAPCPYCAGGADP